MDTPANKEWESTLTKLIPMLWQNFIDFTTKRCAVDALELSAFGDQFREFLATQKGQELVSAFKDDTAKNSSLKPLGERMGEGMRQFVQNSAVNFIPSMEKFAVHVGHLSAFFRHVYGRAGDNIVEQFLAGMNITCTPLPQNTADLAEEVRRKTLASFTNNQQ